jgi:sulfate adenylyltransferase
MDTPTPRQGLTIFLTGLSGAGKSTIAKVLLARLLERDGRPVTILDGDVVRKHFSVDLGFSKEDRDLNVRRVGFLASAIAKSGGVAICALIAPYDEARKEVRTLVEGAGGEFVLVHVATPPSVCEQRDRKGLYVKARAGEIGQFTGISDPYEVPSDAELAIDTTDITAEEAAQRITVHLDRAGCLASSTFASMSAKPVGLSKPAYE